jgi:hypothetical protein
MYERYAPQHTRCGIGWKLYFLLSEEKARQVIRPEGNRDWTEYNTALGNYIGHQQVCPQCSARNAELAKLGRNAIHPTFEGETFMTCKTLQDLWQRWMKGDKSVNGSQIKKHIESCKTCRKSGLSAPLEYLEASENGQKQKAGAI